MKLRGSKTEQDLRDVLIKSHAELFETNQLSRLMQVLKTNFHDMETAYFIDHIPEQGEDIYTLLVNIDVIAKIEISHCSDDEMPVVESSRVSDFRVGLSKIKQIKLEVAIDLAKKDMGVGCKNLFLN
jgi:hypothetical protein